MGCVSASSESQMETGVLSPHTPNKVSHTVPKFQVPFEQDISYNKQAQILRKEKMNTFQILNQKRQY